MERPCQVTAPVDGRLWQTQVDSRALTSSEICDPNVTQVPGRRGETETLVLFDGAETGRNVFSSRGAKTHPTPGRKHGGPTSPGSCGGEQKATRVMRIREAKRRVWPRVHGHVMQSLLDLVHIKNSKFIILGGTKKHGSCMSTNVVCSIVTKYNNTAR